MQSFKVYYWCPIKKNTAGEDLCLIRKLPFPDFIIFPSKFF